MAVGMAYNPPNPEKQRRNQAELDMLREYSIEELLGFVSIHEFMFEDNYQSGVDDVNKLLAAPVSADLRKHNPKGAEILTHNTGGFDDEINKLIDADATYKKLDAIKMPSVARSRAISARRTVSGIIIISGLRS